MRAPRTRHVLPGLLVAVAAAAVLADPAAAHTGHPTDSAAQGLSHPLLGVDHLLAMLAVGAAAALARSRRVAWLTPVGFVAGMAAGALAGTAGVAVPGVELAVAGSVVVLGFAVAARGAALAGWLPAVAVLAGAMHGYAHGTELPAGALPVAYVAGFLAATAALHAAGAAGGHALGRWASLRVAIGSAVGATGVALAVLA